VSSSVWPVVGHTRIRDVLTASVSNDRVPQTLLFAGPAGVGKFTTAVALAQALNCPSAQAGAPCGRCNTCERIALGKFSDVILIDRGDYASISIKVVREKVLALIGYRPFEGRKRVFIIDGADDLTWEAQDSLLKTLEEPPPAAVIILIATSPDALKATVLSRCRRLRFGPLGDDEVARVLSERLGMEAASARSRAAIAGGSVAQALAIDGGSLEDDRERAMALLEASAGSPIAPRLKAAVALTVHEKKRRSREAVSTRLAHLSSFLRDMGMAASAGTPLANPDMADTLSRLARAYPPDRLTQAFGIVARAQHALDRNASPKIVADWVAVGL
jgi:DNA polymerase-3 subunit delta'